MRPACRRTADGAFWLVRCRSSPQPPLSVERFRVFAEDNGLGIRIGGPCTCPKAVAEQESSRAETVFQYPRRNLALCCGRQRVKVRQAYRCRPQARPAAASRRRRNQKTGARPAPASAAACTPLSRTKHRGDHDSHNQVEEEGAAAIAGAIY